jgi:hypothetical protein
MTSGFVHLFITICAACGMILVWQVGVKSLALDAFRARLFEIRRELFYLGESGRIRFDDDAYRMLEARINALIQFAHRVSFITFLLSFVENQRAKRQKDYVNITEEFSLTLSRVADAEVRRDMEHMMERISTALLCYFVITSHVVQLGMLALTFQRLFSPSRVKKREQQTAYVFEREAYITERLRARSASYC